MLIGEDNETLYVRDVDESGENKLLNSWNASQALRMNITSPA